MNSMNGTDFEVLGLRVKAKSVNEGKLSTKEIVEFVNFEASKLRKEIPGLDNGKLAVLVALELAQQQLTLKNDMKVKVDHLASQSENVLSLLDSILPS